jgi:hypothetical protein
MRDSNVANAAKESAQAEFPHGLPDFQTAQRRYGSVLSSIPFLMTTQSGQGDCFFSTRGYRSPAPVRDSAKAQCVIAATSEVIVKAQLQAEFMRRKGLRLRRAA